MTEKLQKALNDQITAELWSANLYLSMSFYLEKEGFSGMAAWMRKQSAEETEHAWEIASYMAKRDAWAKVEKVDVVPQSWDDPVKVFENALEHEKRVTKLIDDLVQVATEEKDNATIDFLWGFVKEQVEEEGKFLKVVNLLKRASETGIYYLDANIGKF